MATRPLETSRPEFDVSTGGSGLPRKDAIADTSHHSRRRLIPNKKMGFGLGTVVAFCVVAVVAPPFLPNAGADNAVGMVHPNLHHLLGTTQTARMFWPSCSLGPGQHLSPRLLQEPSQLRLLSWSASRAIARRRW